MTGTAALVGGRGVHHVEVGEGARRGVPGGRLVEHADEVVSTPVDGGLDGRACDLETRDGSSRGAGCNLDDRDDRCSALHVGDRPGGRARLDNGPGFSDDLEVLLGGRDGQRGVIGALADVDRGSRGSGVHGRLYGVVPGSSAAVVVVVEMDVRRRTHPQRCGRDDSASYRSRYGHGSRPHQRGYRHPDLHVLPHTVALSSKVDADRPPGRFPPAPGQSAPCAPNQRLDDRGSRDRRHRQF